MSTGSGPGVADPLDHPLLDGPEQLDLEPRRHLPNLVEEQGPSRGGLETAGAGRHRPGEGPLDVAEELGFQQSLRDGRAVHRNEGAGDPGGALVDLAGHQLLAGPGLALDEHGDVGRRDLLDAAVDLPHARSGTQQLAVAPALDGLPERLVLPTQIAEEQRVLEEQRRLRGEDGEGLEGAIVEEVADAVVAQVDRAEYLAAGDEGRAHHGLEAEVDDRRGARPLGVVKGVGHHQRATGRQHPLDDGVGDAGHRRLHVSRSDVSGGTNLRSPVDQLDHEALVGPGHLEKGVEEGVEQGLERPGLEQAPREPDQRVLPWGRARRPRAAREAERSGARDRQRGPRRPARGGRWCGAFRSRSVPRRHGQRR